MGGFCILYFGELSVFLDKSGFFRYNRAMKDIQDILIDNLIALRRARGLTQIELGEQVNYSDKTTSKWENGGCVLVYNVSDQFNNFIYQFASQSVQDQTTA